MTLGQGEHIESNYDVINIYFYCIHNGCYFDNIYRFRMRSLCHMENKTYLNKHNYKYTSITIHCSIRGHIINTISSWSTPEFGNTGTYFNVI